MNQRAARRSQAVWVYNTDMHCSQKQQYNAITFPPVAAFLAALSMRQYCSTVLTIRTSCTTLKQCCSLHTLRTNEIKVNYYFWVLLKRKMGKLYRQHSTHSSVKSSEHFLFIGICTCKCWNRWHTIPTCARQNWSLII